MIADIAIVGVGAKLPGAENTAEFWRILKDGRNTVSQRPKGRWNVGRFLRPGEPEPGFSYTFSGGYIDDPFGFDPSVFGISHREARQMDPQQRLLLEVCWRAFEDADIPSSSLSGQNVGVYVGASSVDYQNSASNDPSVMESHYMTGNSLSVLSNRLSHAFNLHGPSFTVDSACSSSFVAVNEAMAALADGRIDLAIVAGVNLLLSPAPFIGFSQARMLSPTGLCRPFSEDADGYVRSEGSVVMLLRRLKDARSEGNAVRGIVMASSANSDGYTPGISLPALDGQKRLLQAVYRDLGVHPDQLAFVEAHGTGTKAGDPIEAKAIGEALGMARSRPLPVGSAKSNVGHLECVSGLVGLLKSCLALENRVLPRSLFSDNLNGAIPFDQLNLAVAKEPVLLQRKPGQERLIAGICNYGFGGTNAHVVVAEGDRHLKSEAGKSSPSSNTPQLIAVSAATKEALKVRATQLAETLASGSRVEDLANALGHSRDILPHRFVMPVAAPGAVAEGLKSIADGRTYERGIANSATWDKSPIAFVFSGNGCQYREMGQTAYKKSSIFRQEIEEIDGHFKPLAGWSIAQLIENGIDAERLALTSVSQPIIYAIQSALASTLVRFGVLPDVVFGHSMGEVAAAEASGALSRKDAVRVIYLRSQHQESVRGKGTMLVVAAGEAKVAEMLASSSIDGVEVAAINGPNSVTVAGPNAALSQFAQECRKHHVATVKLDIQYPFHSSALEPYADAIARDTSFIASQPARIPFISTVTGEELDGRALNGHYWWKNIRNPVMFRKATEAAVAGGTTCFIELGPKPILGGPIKDTSRSLSADTQFMASLSDKDPAEIDPIMQLLAKLVACGARFSHDAVFGQRQAGKVALPPYPMQRSEFTLGGTAEGLTAFGRMARAGSRHALLGDRMAGGSPEWRSLLDPNILPFLSDHQVDGAIVVPASGLVEMALQAGRELFSTDAIEIRELDVFKALAIIPGEIREVSTRWAEQAQTLEIWSRKRFSANEEDWILHARGQLGELTVRKAEPLSPPVVQSIIRNTKAEVYAEATRAGLEYGKQFQMVEGIERDAVTTDSRLAAPLPLLEYHTPFTLHPISFDAALHGLFISRPQKDGETKAYMPVRIRNVRVWVPGASVARSITLLTNETERFKTVAVSLFDVAGNLVASVDAVVLRAVYLSRATVPDRTFRTEVVQLQRPDLSDNLEEARALLRSETINESPEWLLTRAFCASLSQMVLRRLAEDGVEISEAGRPVSGGIPDAALDYLAALHRVSSEFAQASPQQGDLILPPPSVLLATLVNRFSAANMEIRLAAEALEHAERFLRTGEAPQAPQWVLRRFERDAAISSAAQRRLVTVLERILIGQTAPLRVLVVEPFGAALVSALSDFVETGRIDVTFAGTNATSVEEQRQYFKADALVGGLVLRDDLDPPPLAFDVMISFANSADEALDGKLFDKVLDLLGTGAPILVAVPGTDASLDMLRGLWSPWLLREDNGSVVGPVPSQDFVMRQLRKAGAEEIESYPGDNGLGHIVVARAPSRNFDIAVFDNLKHQGRFAVLVDDGGVSLAADFTALIDVVTTSADPTEALTDWLRAVEADESVTLIVPPHALHLAESEQLAHRLEYLQRVLESIEASTKTVRLFVLTEVVTSETAAKTGIEASIHGFVRVAINEYPGIDLRLMHLLPGAQLEDIARVIGMPGLEREWQIDANGASVLRVRRGILPPTQIGDKQRSVLKFDYPGRLDSFTWLVAQRRDLAVGEIEVEVAGVGLNFRDVLVGLGILDDDLLGAGLTAASLGFECSGIITRVGPGVSRFKAGDAVMGFATNAFTSHIVTPAWHFYEVPEGVSVEAAATIPVAFMTAWYALIERAQLKKGEDVLIHGGAGGVGQAAIQIARSVGARVFATASNPMRQRIARVAGADLVFDSRQERFAEEIAAKHSGVDVVLNSLAGKGMLASFGLVKPFGRFIELGKRDFLENTPLGLRPFVRNIQYSGVDIDELLQHDRGLIEAIMAKISDAFRRRELVPLTYTMMDGAETGRAFRSLQASEHIGKIVVRPPRLARTDADQLTFTARAGTHVVIGGTGGFGFATSQWLARNGATTLVLASRRGVVDAELLGEIENMEQQGVRVIVKSLDVRNADEVRYFIAEIRSECEPLRGIVHAAVALDDGLISTLTPERLRGVLGAKVEGLINLDRALADVELDFFVAYSSATTVIGSPGQAAYVAANAFLEGFMERRRAEGKPALAIGWGAISDAGIIARDRSLADRLRRTTGVVGIRANEALAQLGRLLALGNSVAPVQFYSNIGQSEAASKLALINSPAFSSLGLIRAANIGETADDVASAIAGLTPENALEVVIKMMRREVAQILRMPENQIDSDRQMGELGLDSLMALELQLGIERLAGVQVPLVGINNRRLSDVAAMVLHHLGVDMPSDDDSILDMSDEASRLYEIHVTDSSSAAEVEGIRSQVRKKPSAGAAE